MVSFSPRRKGGVGSFWILKERVLALDFLGLSEEDGLGFEERKERQ